MRIAAENRDAVVSSMSSEEENPPAKKCKKSCEAGTVVCSTQGNIFAVSYETRVPRSDDIAVKDENEEAAKRIVRYCDALFDTFLRGIRAAVESNKHLFDKETVGGEVQLLLAENGGAEKLCSKLCMKISTRP